MTANSQTLGAFADFLDLEDVTLIDRSTLEHYATCPWQARAIASGNVNLDSLLASTGTEIHAAFGASILEYFEREAMMNPSEIAESFMSALMGARADVQPEALKAARYSAWPWARFLNGVHCANILRFDGGSDDRSGQLAFDMPGLNLRVTAELDFLHSGPSKQVLHEIDYKSGYKHYGPREIAERFQFQLHAILVFKNYPEVECLQLSVWNLRRGQLSYPVDFERRDLPAMEVRLYAAAGEWHRWHNAPLESVPTWPGIEKCRICSAASQCKAAGLDVIELARDPARFLDEMVALSARLEAMESVAAGYVDARGQDIVAPSGACFGIGKPKAERKASKAIYQAAKTTQESEEENGSANR